MPLLVKIHVSIELLSPYRSSGALIPFAVWLGNECDLGKQKAGARLPALSGFEEFRNGRLPKTPSPFAAAKLTQN
jgi:hypothetical protein